MPNTNSWLCTYAVCQIGRPYWYNTHGQISTVELYKTQVLPKLRELNYSTYNNVDKQLNVKVHDCAGLVAGALCCDNVNGGPVRGLNVRTGATSQFTYDCKTKSNTMKDFPYIPGTLVFETNSKKKSQKLHVGIFVGTYIDLKGQEHNNIVVEARGHAWGVSISKISNSKWDSWGQLSKCKIDTTLDMKFDARTLSTGVMSQLPQTAEMPTIVTDSMTPYVATVLEGYNPTIDYSKIKQAKISAMMFYGGQLYNPSHLKQTYVNPHLAKLVQSCNNAGMPYALYINIRSRNVIEADEECRALYYIISRYSPSLGLWLSLQTNNSVKINNDIIEVYYKYLNKWGLKARCGLYLTKDQLSKITWNSFKDRFYLWLIDPMDMTQATNDLLQPEIFEVPD